MSTESTPIDTTSVTLGLRVPAALKEHLAKLAALDNRSLNQVVVQRLQESCWPSGRSVIQRALDAVRLPKVVRLRSGNTAADLANLRDVTEGFGADLLVFAARPNALNHASLVLIVHTSFTTVLLDESWLSMAREPRTSEVAQLMQHFDALGLLDSAMYCQDLVEDTTGLDEGQAVGRIMATGRPAPFELRGYLDLLSGHGHYDINRFRAAR